jgi:ABC-type lipoprotein export system ATPase subunit
VNEILVEAAALRKTYLSGDMQTEVLKGIDLQIEQGEFCAIMGRSGSGKSTLLHILGTLDTITSGTLTLFHKDVSMLCGKEKAELRRKNIGFVFQSFYLIPGLTVYENVMMPALLDRRKADPAELKALLDSVGLIKRKDHRPSQLSGGEQQRVAIARALTNRPSLLLADEPTGNLDSENSQQILSLLQRINQESGVTVVMVTHSKELAARCNRVIQVKDGMIA